MFGKDLNMLPYCIPAGLYKSLVLMQSNLAKLVGDDPAMRARADLSR